MSVLDALAREVGSTGLLLHKLRPKQWEAPTRCPPLTVLQLTAHMARGAVRIEEMLDQDPVQTEPEKDGVTYWQTDLVAEAPEIVRRSIQAAQDLAPRGPPDMVRAWDERWGRALRRARAADPFSVRPTPFGLMRVEEYLRTRVLEVTVHHMDLDDAIGRAVHPDAEALTIVADVLRALLGTDLRPVGMDDVRFVLAGTGRAELADDERRYLGPLAGRFPLIR